MVWDSAITAKNHTFLRPRVDRRRSTWKDSESTPRSTMWADNSASVVALVVPQMNLILSCFGYLESGMLTTLYHQLSLRLSRLSCKNSRTISPQMASFEVLDEHPKTHLAPPNMMLSREAAGDLLPSHTSLPYSRLGQRTESRNIQRAIKLM